MSGKGSLSACVAQCVLAVYVLSMLVALGLGAHEPLFFGSGFRGGQGIDFFCAPKAYLNLLEGRSAFDTWAAPMYGPHATWFVLHPAVALWVGGYLAWLPPWVAYGAWVGISLSLLALSGRLVGWHATSDLRRVLIYVALLASPVTYLLLLSGNVHGLILLAAALLLVGLYELATAAPHALNIPPRVKVALGLLLSLLSKPVLILVLPALLLARSTRRAAFSSLLAYILISLTLVLVPALNPESVGLRRLAWLVFHPGWVKQELNVYEHGFVLIPEMLDNAMHWLHMLAQADYAWDHVQIFSLPALVRGLVDVPIGAFRLFSLLPVALSPLLLPLSEPRQALALAWLVVLALASHFLGYAVAWEYQYTQLLVVAAAFFALPALRENQPVWIKLALGSLLSLYLPTPYAWLSANGLTPLELALMRAFRVAPAVLVSVACVAAVLQLFRAATLPSVRKKAPA